jgi:hypothetical protein
LRSGSSSAAATFAVTEVSRRIPSRVSPAVTRSPSRTLQS